MGGFFPGLSECASLSRLNGLNDITATYVKCKRRITYPHYEFSMTVKAQKSLRTIVGNADFSRSNRSDGQLSCNERRRWYKVTLHR